MYVIVVYDIVTVHGKDSHIVLGLILRYMYEPDKSTIVIIINFDYLAGKSFL